MKFNIKFLKPDCHKFENGFKIQSSLYGKPRKLTKHASQF